MSWIVLVGVKELPAQQGGDEEAVDGEGDHLSVHQRHGDPVVAYQGPASYPELVDFLENCVKTKVFFYSSFLPGSLNYCTGPD